MKILIIDNSAIAKDNNGRYYTNALNGLFLDDLIECGNQLSYYQFTTEINKTISVYDLEEHKVRCVPIKLKKNKLLNYLKAYLKIIPEIKKTILYIFIIRTHLNMQHFYVGYLVKNMVYILEVCWDWMTIFRIKYTKRHT